MAAANFSRQLHDFVDKDERQLDDALLSLAAEVRADLGTMLADSANHEGTARVAKAVACAKDKFAAIRDKLRDMELLAEEQDT